MLIDAQHYYIKNMFSQLSWLSVDFNNWKDWEDDSEEEMGNFDQLSDVRAMNMLYQITLNWCCFYNMNFTPRLSFQLVKRRETHTEQAAVAELGQV